MKKVKATGVVRRIDELGRLVLPIELRKTFDINVKDSLEIYVDEDSIILKKYNPSCIFCKEANSITQYMGKNVCKNCIAKLSAK